MSPSHASEVAETVVSAICRGDAGAFGEHVAADATLRLWLWNGREMYRPRERVFRRLVEEWSAWDDPELEILDIVTRGQRAVIEYRVWTSEAGVPVEHNRAMFLTFAGDRVAIVDVYAATPTPTANHVGRIAGKLLASGRIDDLLSAQMYMTDTRRECSEDWRVQSRMDIEIGGDGDSHPGSNMVRFARFTPEEADARIAEVVGFHRERNIGFSWLVGLGDTPDDLGERLERQGLVWAGDSAMMARTIGDTSDIKTNPEIAVEVIDEGDDEAIEATLQIVATCFQWPPGRADNFRVFWVDRAKNPSIRKHEIMYVARLDGQAVGFASVSTRAGLAYLDGAATLPEYRGRRIYSTLLRRRLDDAFACGHTVAAILAQPLSYRVVSRYGFEERGKMSLYAWMPVMDMEVIRTLIQGDDDQSTSGQSTSGRVGDWQKPEGEPEGEKEGER